MRLLAIAIVLVLLPAFDDAATVSPAKPALKDTFGFDYMMPKRSKCVKVTGALLKKLQTKYTCTAPEEPTATASGKPAAAMCEVKKGKPSGYVLFAKLADCQDERETQMANGGS